MADPVSDGPIARVERVDPPGMIALRGDLGDGGLAGAVKAATGLGVPDRLTATVSGDAALLWMAPDELLFLCPPEALCDRLTALADTLGARHALAVDVSDMRATFRIDGAGAREVLAKLCPVDMSPDAFPPGTVRRTRLAQIAALVWLGPDGAFRVMCFRSAASYARDVLTGAARPGSAAGVFG